MYESFMKAFKAVIGQPKQEKRPDTAVKTPLEYRVVPPSAIPDTHEPSDEAILRAIQQGIEKENFESSPTEKDPNVEQEVDDEPPPTKRSPDSHPSVKTFVKKHNPHNDSSGHYVEIADE